MQAMQAAHARNSTQQAPIFFFFFYTSSRWPIWYSLTHGWAVCIEANKAFVVLGWTQQEAGVSSVADTGNVWKKKQWLSKPDMTWRNTDHYSHHMTVTLRFQQIQRERLIYWHCFLVLFFSQAQWSALSLQSITLFIFCTAIAFLLCPKTCILKLIDFKLTGDVSTSVSG